MRTRIAITFASLALLTACDFSIGCQDWQACGDDEASDEEEPEPVEVYCLAWLDEPSVYCFYDLPAHDPDGYVARPCTARWDYTVYNAHGVQAATLCMDDDPSQWNTPGGPVSLCEDPTEFFGASGYSLPPEWLDDDMEVPSCTSYEVAAEFPKGIDHCESELAACHARCESDSDCPSREPFCELYGPTPGARYCSDAIAAAGL